MKNHARDCSVRVKKVRWEEGSDVESGPGDVELINNIEINLAVSQTGCSIRTNFFSTVSSLMNTL